MGVRRFKTALGSQVKNYGTGSSRIKVVASSSGGSITVAGGYTTHSITATGSTAFSINVGASIDYLIVAGGGSGNQGFINAPNLGGGGGGAGGMLTGSMSISSGSYALNVGAGGIFVANLQSAAANGSNSTGFGLTAIGGGGGGMQSRTGANGGSGGGGGGNDTAGGTGTAGQGNNGGTGSSYPPGNAGGGGGAGSAGAVLTAGSGIANSISGSSVTYATGGTGATGGSSGAGSAGAANTGNGGGGGQQTSAGGNGGSGIIIIRYLTNSIGYSFD